MLLFFLIKFLLSNFIFLISSFFLLDIDSKAFFLFVSFLFSLFDDHLLYVYLILSILSELLLLLALIKLLFGTFNKIFNLLIGLLFPV